MGAWGMGERLRRAPDAASSRVMPRIPPPDFSPADRPPVVLVGVQLQGVSDEALDGSLTELQRLAETLGLRVIGRVTSSTSSPDGAPSAALGFIRYQHAEIGNRVVIDDVGGAEIDLVIGG